MPDPVFTFDDFGDDAPPPQKEGLLKKGWRMATHPLAETLGGKAALERFAQPGLNDSPLKAKLKGFASGALESITPGTLAEIAALPAMAAEVPAASVLSKVPALGRILSGAQSVNTAIPAAAQAALGAGSALQGAKGVVDAKNNLEQGNYGTAALDAGGAVLGGLGARAGLKGYQNASKLASATSTIGEATKASSQDGLRVAVDELSKAPRLHNSPEGQPFPATKLGPDGKPGFPVPSDVVAKQAALDAETLKNPGSKVAIDIFGPDGRPGVDSGKVVKPSVVEMEKLHGEANAAKAKADAEAAAAPVKVWGQTAKNLTTREKFIQKDYDQTGKNLNAAGKYIDKNNVQEGKNLTAAEKYKQGIVKAQAAASTEDAKRADALVFQGNAEAQQGKIDSVLDNPENVKTGGERVNLATKGKGPDGESASLRESVGPAPADPAEVPGNVGPNGPGPGGAPSEPPAPAPYNPKLIHPNRKSAVTEANRLNGLGDGNDYNAVKDPSGNFYVMPRSQATGLPPEAPGGALPLEGSPTPDGPGPGQSDATLKNQLHGKVMSKTEADVFKKHLGAEVNQVSDRKFQVKFPQEQGSTIEDAPSVADDTGIPPSDAPAFKPSTPFVPDATPAAPNKMGDLSPDEYRRYMDVRPMRGVTRTPEETAEFKALHDRINAPKPTLTADVTDYTQGDVPTVDVPPPAGGAASDPTEGLPLGGQEPGFLPPQGRAAGPLPGNLADEALGNAMSDVSNPIEGEPGFLPDSTPEDAQASYDRMKASKDAGAFVPEEVRASMGEDVGRLKKGVIPAAKPAAPQAPIADQLQSSLDAQNPPPPPFVNPQGEAEPVLPGVNPTVNPPAPPVGDLPFSLDGGTPSTPKSPVPQPSLLDVAGAPAAPEGGLSPQDAEKLEQLKAGLAEARTPLEQTLMQRLLSKFMSEKGLGGGQGGAISSDLLSRLAGAGVGATAGNSYDPLNNKPASMATGAGLGFFAPDLARAGAKAAPAIENLLGNNRDRIASGARFMNQLHNSALLSPLSVLKKGAGDVGGMALAGIEHPDRAGALLKQFLSKEGRANTWSNFKTGYNGPEQEPTGGLELSGILNHKLNPLSLSGRAMSGLTVATKGALGESGFSVPEQKYYTQTAEPAYKTTKDLFNGIRHGEFAKHLVPFARVGINRLERGYEYSPLGLANKLMKPYANNTGIARKAITGTLAGTVAYQATPENFVKDHPIVASSMAAAGGPLGLPVLAGMALKNAHRQPNDPYHMYPDVSKLSDATGEIARDVPGLRLIEDASGKNPTGFARNYLSGYTNSMRPLALANQYLNEGNTEDPDLSSKDLSQTEQLTNRALSNIPGVRETLPKKKVSLVPKFKLDF